MISKSFWMTEELDGYMVATWLRETPELSALRAVNEAHPSGGYAISPEQGQFFGMLVKLLNVQSYLEVGTFTGYSALAIAQAMGPAGRITCCDISEEFTSIAREHWATAGVQDNIELKLGPAADSLADLVTEGRVYDLCFIDADKPGYPTYYEFALKLVRPGGLILIDNVLWNGRITHHAPDDESTSTMQRLNALIHGDPRVEIAIVPIGDGVTFCRVLP
jgi:predicted O-methyltransferase YrrM